MKPRPPIAIRTLAPALAALVLLAGRPADASSIYGVTDLGANVSSLRLNNAGQVAGLRGSDGFLYSNDQSTPLAPGVQPIALAEDGRVIDARGPFTYYNGGDLYRNQVHVDRPVAGNHLGQLVGTSFTTPYDPPDPTQIPAPYLYTPYPAGSPPSGQYLSALRNMYGYNGPFPMPAADDPTGRGTIDRPDLPNIHPTGINDSGQIIGNYFPSDPSFPNTGPRPLYTSHAVLNNQDLGTPVGANSYADAINNAGQVTGRSDTMAGADRAFLYTSGKMIDLGVLPGMAHSEGLGLNEKGDVVGSSGGHAFLYHASTGIMEDLNDRLPPASGLTLDEATAINDAGQVLAYGHGADGVEHGLLLSPVPTPEPSTLALLGLAAAGLGVRRLRNPRS